MNQYEVCRTIVQAGGMTSIEKVMNATGLSQGKLNAILIRLTGDGVIIRDRDTVKLKNAALARELAGMADSPPADAAPRFAPTVVAKPKPDITGDTKKRVRPEIPVGLEILSGLEIPNKRTAARPIVLPLGKMAPGQCVLIPIPDGSDTRAMAERCRIEVAAYKKRINPNFNATIRATVFPPEHKQFGEPCVGVWCILAEQAERAANAKVRAVK
jgi:hypothetical protein